MNVKLHFAGTLWNKLKAMVSILMTGAIDIHPDDEEALYKGMKYQRMKQSSPPGLPQEPHLLQFTNKGNPIFVPFSHIRGDGIYYEIGDMTPK
jgi:hypothetical protein